MSREINNDLILLHRLFNNKDSITEIITLGSRSLLYSLTAVLILLKVNEYTFCDEHYTLAIFTN